MEQIDFNKRNLLKKFGVGAIGLTALALGSKSALAMPFAFRDRETQTDLINLGGDNGSIIGSLSPGGNLTLQSTSHATKGKILFGTSAYDEVNNRLGIGTASPDAIQTVKYSGGQGSIGVTNLVTNGDFETQALTPFSGSYWAIENDAINGWQAYHTNTTRTNALQQTISITAGKLYKVKLKVVQRSGTTLAGYINVRIGMTTGGPNTTSATAGDFTVYLEAGSENSYLQLGPRSSFNGAVDNVEVYEIAGNEPFRRIYDSSDRIVHEERGFYSGDTGLNSAIFLGAGSGRFACYGTGCVGLGYHALYNHIDGFGNVALGIEALRDSQITQYNFALGTYALRALILGDLNVGVGTNAGAFLTNGDRNTFVGSFAGANQTAGRGNTVIGMLRDAPSLTGNDQLVIGTETYEYIRGVSNSIRIGGGANPTARLHLPAGTATASTAPLKFISGVSLTAAEAGAMEFTTDDLFFTITTGTARKGIVLDDGTRLTSGKIPVATTNGRLVDLTAQAHEADAKADYAAGDLDTEAEVIAAINATNAKINALLVKLENLKLLATS